MNTHADKTPQSACWGMEALEERARVQERFQAANASRREEWISANAYYYRQVTNLLRFIIEPQTRVLVLRSETGFLLDALSPERGVGTELSDEMVLLAKRRYPAYEFHKLQSERFKLNEKFDYVVFNNISDTVDIAASLRQIHAVSEPWTRLVIYTYNSWWEPIIRLAEKFGLKTPFHEPNWLSPVDIENLLTIGDFELLRVYRIILVPKYIPLLSEFLNRFIAPLPLINRLCMVSTFVARPKMHRSESNKSRVSLIIPCKNEEGNIEPAVKRIPEMGSHVEIIFCDDHSTDQTAAEVRRMQTTFPARDIKLVTGPGISKARNVWTGFEQATGDILMILDADLAVMPEELPLFFDALVSGKGEFINGSRLVYPIPNAAMKYFNMLGNKVFSWIFSYLLFQPIGDTLCGTKVLFRRDWERMKHSLGRWGVEDRWGDYELLFGAAKLHLKILDLPVHYQERIYGVTKMVRVFHNGLIMLRLCGGMLLKFRLRYYSSGEPPLSSVSRQ